MAFIVIHVPGDTPADSYWTLLDAASGETLGPDYRFAAQQEAEAMADSMNGVDTDAAVIEGGTPAEPAPSE